MRALLVLALAGCNAFYGLDPVKIVDAQVFDAATSCPPSGGSLVYSRVLEQLTYDCTSYTASNDRAIALCREPSAYQVHGGPPEGPFAPIAELPRSDGLTLILHRVQLSPDGTHLFLSLRDGNATELRSYHLVNNTWIRDADVAAAPVVTTNASRAPDRRMLGFSFGDLAMAEFSDASGTWQEIAKHPVATFGLVTVSPVWLSGDALRLVFFGSTDTTFPAIMSLRYAVRSSTADTFQTSQTIALPMVGDVFVTDDCARIYFSALRSIFYAPRL
jgi:hypothetical protein